jgi:glycerol-3-phosphate acyltransferase PlsY
MNAASAAMIAAAYLAGAVPFGILFSRWLRGIDPREHGSRNIGFTNVLRTAGRVPGILTLVGDMGKGALAVMVARQVAGEGWVPVLSGAAAVLGHNYPVTLGFRGGKGVATGFGAVLGLDPAIGGCVLAVWLAVAALFRYSSLAALCAFVLLPVIVFFLRNQIDYLVFSFGLSAMILIRHRANILRLWKGTEPKLGAT